MVFDFSSWLWGLCRELVTRQRNAIMHLSIYTARDFYEHGVAVGFIISRLSFRVLFSLGIGLLLLSMDIVVRTVFIF